MTIEHGLADLAQRRTARACATPAAITGNGAAAATSPPRPSWLTDRSPSTTSAASEAKPARTQLEDAAPPASSVPSPRATSRTPMVCTSNRVDASVDPAIFGRISNAIPTPTRTPPIARAKTRARPPGDVAPASAKFASVLRTCLMRSVSRLRMRETARRTALDRQTPRVSFAGSPSGAASWSGMPRGLSGGDFHTGNAVGLAFAEQLSTDGITGSGGR
jgi:hypothetical protein